MNYMAGINDGAAMVMITSYREAKLRNMLERLTTQNS